MLWNQLRDNGLANHSLDIIENDEGKFYVLYPFYENPADAVNDPGEYYIMEVFEKDGEEELAVYLPNNYSETKNGYICAEYYVDIFKIDVENKSVTTTQRINLSSKLGSEYCEWEYTHKENANNNGRSTNIKIIPICYF